MADHEHGSMDITAHEQTFGGFVRLITRAAILIIVGLIFLALVNA